MKVVRSMLFVVIALALCGPAASAQTVRGRILDAQSGTPIAGGFVRLIDDTGKRVAEMLTNDAGAYRLSGPAGKYTLRVERLGYKTFETPAFALDTSLVRDLRLPQEAIELPSITATAESRCDARDGMAATAATVWEEVRKALSITSWTSQQGAVFFQILSRRQTLSIGRGRVIDETSDIRTGTLSGSPFASLTPDSLMKNGFIQKNENGDPQYYGPDAELIMSDAFQQSHCFHAVVDRKQPGMVGLAFTSTGMIKPSDVEGTLWIEKKSYELKRLEFSYNKLSVEAPRSTAGGIVHFTRLSTGMWIISAWKLEAPIITKAGMTLGSRPMVSGIQRVSQRVLTAYVGNTLIFSAPEEDDK